jgi:DNA-binding response OmpR family regulator
MRILLVEDDDRFADALMVALRRQGFDVSRAGTAAAALDAPEPDLVLLDLGLPDLDGIEVCRRLRGGADVAIIAITARGDERDRVIGLRSGADDYVVKPFGIAELSARIDAVMRRVRPPARPAVTVRGLRVDLARRLVTGAGGSEIALTRKEFELLAALAREPGVVVSRERLLAEVWHSTWPGGRRTLDVHMATLRAKLGDPAVVQTVHGVGYRLAVRDGTGEPSGAGRPAKGT